MDAHFTITKSGASIFFSFFCSNLLGQIVGRIAGITVDLKVQPLGEGKWLLATGIRPGDRVQ